MSGHTKEDCPYSEKIEELDKKVNQKEWYSNKDLHNYIIQLFKKFDNLSNKLDETSDKIDEYNGLRDDIQDYKAELEEIKNKKKGKLEFAHWFIRWCGWRIAILSLGLTIYRFWG